MIPNALPFEVDLKILKKYKDADYISIGVAWHSKKQRHFSMKGVVCAVSLSLNFILERKLNF